jgi:hypothetical protein
VQHINTFLKLIAEASGYPDWVQFPEDEDKYIQRFLESEGIALDKVSITKNSAKRGLAKLRLNSLWGKLTGRNNRTKTKMITDLQELYRFLVTPGKEVCTSLFASDDVVWLTWRFMEEEKIPSLRHTKS